MCECMYVCVCMYKCIHVHKSVKGTYKCMSLRHYNCDLNLHNTNVYMTYVLIDACIIYAYTYVRTCKAYICVGMLACIYIENMYLIIV